MNEIIWKEWLFKEAVDSPIFGKMKIEASRGEVAEVFYIYCEELTEEVCEEIYENYLYSYG